MPMLPLSLDGVLTQDVQPGQGLPMTRQRYMDMLRKRAELEDQTPDTSAMQEYAKSRSAGGETAMLNALAAQFAGERFAPFQAQYLKRAAEAQQPMKLGRGMLTATGQFLDDPFARQNQQVDRLSREIGGLERLMSAEEIAAAKREADAAAKAAELERKRERDKDRAAFERATLAARADAAGRAEDKANKPRELPWNAIKDISEQAGSAEKLADITADFKDAYASPLPGVPGVGALTNAAGRAGLGSEDKANWWQRYNEHINIVRNQLFGSALTAMERSAFDAAMIGPDMAPSVIKRRLAQQAKAADDAYKKLVQSAAGSNFNVQGVPQLRPRTETKAEPKETGKVPAGVDPKVWAVMTPEERALWK